MFADNQRISRRQLARQLLLGLSGGFLLTMPQITDLMGWSGILGFLLGTLLVWIYLFFLVRTTAVAKSLKDRIGRPFYIIIAIFYLCYLVMSGGYLIRMTSQMLSFSLLPEYQPWLIGLLFIAAAFIGTGGDLQRRGRLGEVCCIPVVGGLFLMVILAAFQIKNADLSSWALPTAVGVVKSTYHVFSSFSIVGILPFLMHRVERSQSSVKYLFAATGTASLLGAGSVLVIQLLFGIQGTGQKMLPLTSLMSAVNFPGGFLDRFDAVWMIFLLFALLYSVGTVFYYGQHLIRGKESPWCRILLAGTVFAAAFLRVKGKTVFDVYPWCVRYIYMPVFVIFGLSLARFRRKT